MPSRITPENKHRVYKALMETMPDITFRESSKYFLVRTEMLKRSLTKRQRVIIEFISTLSHFYNKDAAVIPRLRDWELAGISKTHVKAELERLEEMYVIEWDRTFNEFRILPPSEWDAPINYGYNNDRSRELFMLNLKHAGVDVEKVIKESLEAER